MKLSKRYRIYPSLLDAFAYAQGIEDEETRARIYGELIDKINRVSQPPTEAASRGTALNELVDLLSAGEVMPENYRKLPSGNYSASIDGFMFIFCGALVEHLANKFKGHLPQVYCEHDLSCDRGVVTLYGYADYLCGDTITDLKTTSNYSVGKFRSNFQHLVYPYCLVGSGMMERCDTFRYLVAEVKEDRDGVIQGIFYSEDYNVSMTECAERIRHYLDYEFLPWLEDHRGEITNSKIFGE